MTDTICSAPKVGTVWTNRETGWRLRVHTVVRNTVYSCAAYSEFPDPVCTEHTLLRYHQAATEVLEP